jgi:hypothetical protein
MNEHDAVEAAFNNGYAKGYADGKAEAEGEIRILKQKRVNLFERLDAFEKGKAAAMKWISVKDRLPDEDGKYLVYKVWGRLCWCEVLSFAKDGRKVDKYDFHRGWKNVWYRYDSECGYLTIDDVTHWMTLPPAPKGE